jgi:prolyl-tRNA editing enzyme YbaK/EbsC (Cys-tRNA(Pro) deacylase)
MTLSTEPTPTSEGFARVTAALQALAHPDLPRWLEASARTAQEAADALGVELGQIAKSVVFRSRVDDSAILVIAPGDRRIHEPSLKQLTGPLARADADFVKARTGFSIGGVSPLGFAPAPGLPAPRLFLDRGLFRFPVVWAAAGHPNGVFPVRPDELARLSQAPVVEVCPA